MDIRIRRVYAPLQADDGTRVLVDRLWPRGVAKAKLQGVEWLKAVAPSEALRKSFAHQPERWAEFRRRYFAELDANPEPVNALRKLAGRGRLTLLYAARDEAHNNALALREYLLGNHRAGAG
jgi:uncharacterized protein YeaO (DUF488 family)